MILRVGLTGGLASGKSTIAKMFADRGCYVVDADHVVRDLYRPGAKGYQALLETYGPGILREDGEIDRAKLSDIALSSTNGARQLNALIHPLVAEREAEVLVELTPLYRDRDLIAVVEATLLIESGSRTRYHRVVVVDVEPDVQVERAMQRGMSKEEAIKRMSRQMPRDKRLSYADYVIDNSGGVAAASPQVDRVLQALQSDLETLKRNRAHA